ncbi:hypothetical protein Bca4012_056426 [Brassica carinata]
MPLRRRRLAGAVRPPPPPPFPFFCFIFYARFVFGGFSWIFRCLLVADPDTSVVLWWSSGGAEYKRHNGGGFPVRKRDLGAGFVSSQIHRRVRLSLQPAFRIVGRGSEQCSLLAVEVSWLLGWA